MPGTSAERRTAAGEANFTEAEPSVIANNTGLAACVCFRRTWSGGKKERRNQISQTGLAFYKEASSPVMGLAVFNR